MYNYIFHLQKSRGAVMKDLNSPHFAKNSNSISIASIEMASPFKHVDVAFHWKNTDFPFLHTHAHWELFTIMQDEIHHTINGVKNIYKKGDSCLIRPQDRHCFNFIEGHEKNYQQLNLTFSNEFAKQIISPHRDYETLLNSSETLHFTLKEADIASIYDQCLFTQNLPKEEYEASTKLIISKLLLNFFEQYLLFNSNYPVWFNNFLTYISNPINFNKTLKELAEDTPYSYSRLATIFKDYVGISLIDYYTDKKMTNAKRLLRTTSLTTLQIAEKCGYDSLSAFNHLFKKFYGVTPSKYRKEQS